MSDRPAPLSAACTITIAQPVERVFAFVTDLPATPRWRTSVKEVTPPVEGELDLGVRFGAATRVLGKRWEWVLEVTAWEPPHRFGYEVVEGSAALAVTYVCEPDGDGCRFTLRGEGKRPGGLFGAVVVPAARRVMTRDMRRHLGNLKALLEPRA